jgi:Uma2 family endonuclease
MQEWLANGAQLGWLIDPERRTVAIYRPGAEVELCAAIERLAGEGPVAGFVLELAAVWNPLGV